MKFLLARNKNKFLPGGHLIMWAEQVDFSHCAILIDGYVYESVWPKARKIKLEDWLKKYEVAHWFEPYEFQHQVDKVKAQVEDWIGYPYSVFQLGIIGLGIVFKCWDKILSGINWNGRKYLICSELLGEVLENNFGVTFGEKLDTLGVRDIWICLNKLKDEKKWPSSDQLNLS